METRAEALNLMSKYLFLLVKDLRQCYELADDTLDTLRNANASSSSHSVSIGNHDQDSEELNPIVVHTSSEVTQNQNDGAHDGADDTRIEFHYYAFLC